jgi:hypothetical protein
MTQEVQLFKAEDFAVVKDIGTAVAKSGMFGLDRSEAGTVVTLLSSPQGAQLFNWLRTYDVVLGKPRKKALACLAEFRQRGGRVKWVNTGDDGKEAVGEFAFEGETLTVKFTIDDAKKQGLVKSDSAWVKTPGNMMRARCITNAIGMLCPEIVAGVVDGDDETPSVEPKPILQATPAPTPAQPKKVQVVEAEIVQPKTETASPEPAPTFVPEAAPVQAATSEIFVVKTEGIPGDAQFRERLTAETVNKLIEVLGSHSDAAMKWMVARNWLAKQKVKTEAGESETVDLRLLSPNRAQLILNKPQDFINKVNTVGAQ